MLNRWGVIFNSIMNILKIVNNVIDRRYNVYCIISSLTVVKTKKSCKCPWLRHLQDFSCAPSMGVL